MAASHTAAANPVMSLAGHGPTLGVGHHEVLWARWSFPGKDRRNPFARQVPASRRLDGVQRIGIDRLGNPGRRSAGLAGEAMSDRTAVYDFGGYRLDARTRVLSLRDRPIALAPKSFDLLLLLVERRGRVLERDELIRELWPDTVVEEANLTFQVSTVRKALGEDGSKWIETVPKHGYRFSAPVREARPEANASGRRATGGREISRAARLAGRRDRLGGGYRARGARVLAASGADRPPGRAAGSDRGAAHHLSRFGDLPHAVPRWQPGGFLVGGLQRGQRGHLLEARRPGRASSAHDRPGTRLQSRVVTRRPPDRLPAIAGRRRYRSLAAYT